MIVVARHVNEFGEIEIRRSRKDGSHAYVRGDWYHSHADRSGVSLAGYVHAIYGLVLQSDAARVLVLGCAGGTLATMLARAGKRVTTVDIDPDAFDLARTFFALAPEIDCHVADARNFLERTATPFDAIVVDSFFRNALPEHLCSTEFFLLARRRLTPGGMILFNAVVAHDLDRIADRLAAGMAEAGLSTRILETGGERDRNAIVLGGSVGRLRRPGLLVATDTMSDVLAAELDAMAFRERRRTDPIRDSG
jgi:spermidine synthase